jgi:hypothetical protein
MVPLLNSWAAISWELEQNTDPGHSGAKLPNWLPQQDENSQASASVFGVKGDWQF